MTIICGRDNGMFVHKLFFSQHKTLEVNSIQKPIVNEIYLVHNSNC